MDRVCQQIAIGIQQAEIHTPCIKSKAVKCTRLLNGRVNFLQQCFHIPAEMTALFDGDIFKAMDFLVVEVLSIVHGSNRTSAGSAKVEGQHSFCFTH